MNPVPRPSLPLPEFVVSPISAIATRNLLLQALPYRERHRLLASCELADLHAGEVLCAPRLSPRHVHFPLSGFVSLIVHLPGHPAMATGLVGDEGLVGATLMLGASPAPIRALVMGAGQSLRMTVPHFQRALCHCPQLLRRLNLHLQLLLPQLSRTATCTRLHSLEQRLVCWLLMTQDRSRSDRLALTVDLLANNLGASVNAVRRELAALDRRGLIRQGPELIRIVERPSLEAVACSCYELILEGYLQSFGLAVAGTVEPRVPIRSYVRQRTETRARTH